MLIADSVAVAICGCAGVAGGTAAVETVTKGVANGDSSPAADCTATLAE